LFFQVGGYPELKYSNRVVVAHSSDNLESDPPEFGPSFPQVPSPAEEAGLRSGDVILKIGNREVERFQDIKLAVALAAGKNLDLEYLRDEKVLRGILRPAKNAQGGGWVGLAPWTDLVLKRAYDGLEVGMRLDKVNNEAVANGYELFQWLAGRDPEEDVSVQWQGRNGEPVRQNRKAGELGQFEFVSETWVRSPNIALAFTASFNKLKAMFALQMEGLSLLFRGRLQWKDNLAGPIRISDQIGQVMANGSFRQRWYGSWQFLGFISFVIALVNLLPLAVLDGGQILLYSVELIFRKPLHPRGLAVYQSLGSFVIIGLMILIFGLELFYYVGF
ncbi:MAG: M50 family metallopeptidase, partial [Spirochaetota bacterium]